MQSYMHTNTYIQANMHTYIHVCIHIHTHTGMHTTNIAGRHATHTQGHTANAYRQSYRIYIQPCVHVYILVAHTYNHTHIQ